MKITMPWKLALGAAFGLVGIAYAEPAPVQALTGTLFQTPAERARLDRLRSGVVVQSTTTVAPPTFSPPVAVTEPVINGFVKRSDGNSTLWVDGKSVEDASPELVGAVQPMDVGDQTGLHRFDALYPAVKNAIPVRGAKKSSPRKKRSVKLPPLEPRGVR